MKKILKIEIWRREEGKGEKISEKQNHCVNLSLWFKQPCITFFCFDQEHSKSYTENGSDV